MSLKNKNRQPPDYIPGYVSVGKVEFPLSCNTFPEKEIRRLFYFWSSSHIQLMKFCCNSL